MNLLRLFSRPRSAPAARERLQVLLAHERAATGGDADLLGKLRDEILRAISKHMQIDDDKVSVRMERGPQVSTLAVDIEVPFDADLDALLPAASGALRKVDGGDGVLVLVDMYGASPSNLAARLAQLGTPVKRVAGANLPMLLRVMNYPEQSLAELQSTASVGGRNAVMLDDPG